MKFIYGSRLAADVRLAFPVLFLVAFAATADARFADAEGFSGKHGITCVSCHFPEVVELGTPASIDLTGLPIAWDASVSYPLTITVVGGPPGNPAPDTPQAGFDIETDLGSFEAGPDMDGLVRIPSAQEATYTGVGTFLRSWNLVWTTPNVSGYPGNATFWIGVVAANGNHVMNGPEVTGERGDRTATGQFVVPPSEKTIAAWDLQPLPKPILQPYTVPATGASSVIIGVVADFADGAEVRIDSGPWHGATGAPGFSFPLPPWQPGDHVIEARAVWRDRTSDVVSVPVHVPGDAQPAASTDEVGKGPGLWVFLVLLLAFPLVPLLLRSRR